jgi:NAD(P)H-hydrate epimerase
MRTIGCVSGTPTLSRDAVRELDRRAIEVFGIPSALLMENAGRACAEEALRLVAGDARPVVVVVGPGNNGGDGLVIARTLANRGIAVRVLCIGGLEKLEGGSADVQLNLRLWRWLGGDVEPVEDAALLARALEDSALVVDALFGTGLTRPLEGEWRAAVLAIESAGEAGWPVLAVDLPSGLDCDTGAVLGAAVRATVTVTFVAPKPGFERGEGPARCGRVVVAEIGIPRAWVEEAQSAAK